MTDEEWKELHELTRRNLPIRNPPPIPKPACLQNEAKMKTVESMQDAVDAIKEVCRQHGVALVGVCYAEGIHGEIEIIDAAEVEDGDMIRLTNKVELLDGRTAYVEGIGEPGAA